MRTIPERYRIKDMIELGNRCCGRKKSSIQIQIDFSRSNRICRLRHPVSSSDCDIQRTIVRIDGGPVLNRGIILRIGYCHLDGGSNIIRNRIRERVSLGNGIGISCLIGSGQGDDQGAVGIKSRTDRGQQILDDDIAGFINLDGFSHAGALSRNRDFFKVDIVSGSPQCERFVICNSSCRIRL